MPAVKFAKGSELIYEGLAIPFGDPEHLDLDREFFTKNTDLCPDWFPDGRPQLYHHGRNETTKTAVVGRQKTFDVGDEGVWIQGELNKHSQYLSAVQKLIDEGAVGLSSGAMGHLVETDSKTGEIKRWPWVEQSFTPTPAHPGAEVGWYAVKSMDLASHLTEIDTAIPPQVMVAIMKSFDERDSVNESYSEAGQRVLAAVKAFVERSEDRREARAKADRLLSADDRSRLTELQAYIWSISSDVDALLRVSDPQASDRMDEATQLFAEFSAIEARLNGVMV